MHIDMPKIQLQQLTAIIIVISQNKYKYQLFHQDLLMYYLESPFVLYLSPPDST